MRDHDPEWTIKAREERIPEETCYQVQVAGKGTGRRCVGVLQPELRVGDVGVGVAARHRSGKEGQDGHNGREHG